MKKRILLWLSLAVVLGVAVLTGVVGLQPAARPEQSFRTANGDVVTLVAVTYGTNHTLAWGKPYQRLLYRILPTRFKSWAGCKVETSSSTDTNTPMFWVHATIYHDVWEFGLLDEFGCEHDTRSGGGGRRQLAGALGVISHFQYRAGFSGKIVGLCLYDSDRKTNRLGILRIPGSLKVSVPQTKSPLPEARLAGDLSCKLGSLIIGLKESDTEEDKVFSQAVLAITSNGIPVKTWHPSLIKITDAKGKVYEPSFPELARRDNDFVLNFEEQLDPQAGPFKFQIELEHQTPFEADELVTIHGVPFPAMEQIVELDLRTNIQGKTMILERVFGTKTRQPQSLGMITGRIWYQPGPCVTLMFSPVSNDMHCELLGAKDETGKEVLLVSSTQQRDAQDSYPTKFCYFFKQSDSAKFMDLSFAVHKSRFVEFEATPEVFKPMPK